METAEVAGERIALPLALGALLAPWAMLSLLLPLKLMGVAFTLLTLLALLLHLASRWSRMRAEQLGLPSDGWALAAVLSLGFSMFMLLGKGAASGFDALCDDCGRLSDARGPFCMGCGTYF